MMKQSSRQIILIIFILAALFYAALSAHATPKRKFKGQMQPDPQRKPRLLAMIAACSSAPMQRPW
jgi:hypothetical protein